MNRLKTLLLTAMLLCNTAAFAETVVIDGITYDVVTKAKVATVIQSEPKYSGEIVIPEAIEHNGVTCSVTSIGSSAFWYCSGLTSIVIPNSVTSIGGIAFEDCTGLTSVEIPNSVTSIGERAFKDCDGLTSVVIPNSVTSIGTEAFAYCFRLTAVHISNLSAWYNIDFSDSSANPLHYAKNLYLNGDLVTELVIPDDVTEIKDCTFDGCSGLTSVEIPNSVTSIGHGAFSGCSGLTSIVIGNSVTSIGSSAFYGCSGLTSIEIPNSVTSIEDSAFYGCSGLTSIEIPNSVTSIGRCAFLGCSGLTSIEIPNSVTSIGVWAFQHCSKLTSIEIPNSVTSIEYRAFDACTGLTSVTIGKGIKNIGEHAFARCSNLTDVYCLAEIVPETSTNAFNESYPEYMTLHVPAEAINSYKTTEPWNSFGTIVTLDGTEIENPVCAIPVITYSEGKLTIECETEGAEFVTSVTNDYIKTYYTSSFELAATYNISVYATAAGHENSETVNVILCWIENSENNEDEDNTTGVINIPATAVPVTSTGGTITIDCEMNGEKMEVYTTDGVIIGSATIENGTATVNTGLEKGSVAIVNIAGKSIKVIVG